MTGIALSALNAVHIATSAKADGVVADVQESQSWDEYSFYVDYATPQGSFHQRAFTSTPFSKNAGDKVTALYKRGRSAERGESWHSTSIGSLVRCCWPWAQRSL